MLMRQKKKKTQTHTKWKKINEPIDTAAIETAAAAVAEQQQ